MRLKRDINHITTREDGLKLYSFRYLWNQTFRVSLMAQDLLASDVGREAVIETGDGSYAVDYARLGLRMVTLETWRAQGPVSVELRQ